MLDNNEKNEALMAEEKYKSAVESASDYIENFDILETITNVGNDEVFTPRKTCDMILDSLPEEVWHNPNYKWLNPATKNGIFEREIAIRLDAGLKNIITDTEKRRKHILQNMIFSIGQTRFTANVARRTVYYCSQANRKCDGIKAEDGHYVNGYAIGNGTWFSDEEGNIKTPNIAHAFVDSNGKLMPDLCKPDERKKYRCKYCGINGNSSYNDSNQRETYAYEFIHFNKEKILEHLQDRFFGGDKNMKFDIIIGNPPYQLSDGGGDGSSAAPIYQLFVEQAILLKPKYMSMIIPARWYSGGKGLDEFRDKMLHDKRIYELHDFPETSDVFNQLNIRGGICYFLWDSSYFGDCNIYNHKNKKFKFVKRPIIENGVSTFIRYNEAISILNKVKKLNEPTMDSKVSSRLPFGIESNFENYETTIKNGASIRLYRSERGTNKTSKSEFYINPKYILKNKEWTTRKKVLVSKASPGGDEYPHSIISQPIFADVNSACTETYLIVDFVDTTEEGLNLISYMKTKFFRFMMCLIKNTQNISKSVFAFVPIQDISKPWTDDELYKKYKFTKDEIEFIDSMIREMK